eukprot:7333102-Lingulodinium_polyedra.AAC.1
MIKYRMFEDGALNNACRSDLFRLVLGQRDAVCRHNVGLQRFQVLPNRLPPKAVGNGEVLRVNAAVLEGEGKDCLDGVLLPRVNGLAGQPHHPFRWRGLDVIPLPIVPGIRAVPLEPTDVDFGFAHRLQVAHKLVQREHFHFAPLGLVLHQCLVLSHGR